MIYMMHVKVNKTNLHDDMMHVKVKLTNTHHNATNFHAQTGSIYQNPSTEIHVIKAIL